MAMQRLSNIGLELDRARTQCGACNRQATTQDLTHVYCRFTSTQYGDYDDTPFVRQTFDVPVYIFTCDHVKNDVHAFIVGRSEERRVGKECRSGWSQYY